MIGSAAEPSSAGFAVFLAGGFVLAADFATFLAVFFTIFFSFALFLAFAMFVPPYLC